MQLKKTIYLGGVGLGLFVHALLSDHVYAQEPKPLDEVVITANRSPKKLADVGKVVQVITADQLARSQGRTLLEVLNTVVGLTVGGNSTGMGEPKSIFLRGASGANTLILIDGVPANNASGVTGEYDITAIPIDMVARVEIIKGGNSTLYGSDAVAGVINIITHKDYNQPIHIGVLGTVGSYESFKQAFNGGGLIKRTSFAFNGSNLTSGGFSSAMSRNGSSSFEKNGFEQRALSLRVGEQLNDRLCLNGNFFWNTNQASFDAGAYQDVLGNTYSKTSYLGGLGVSLSVLQGELMINLSQNNIKNHFNYTAPSNSIAHYESEISNLEIGLNSPLNSLVSLTSGLSYKYSATKQANAYSALGAHNAIISAFASLFLKTKGGFRSELGGRYNYHTQYGSNLTYTINPSYLFLDRYKVFANLSSAYRVPSLYQLFTPQFGNTLLKPEHSTTFEIGFDLAILLEKLSVSLSYFDRRINDVIDYVPIAVNRSMYINQNKQKDRGFELELRMKPHRVICANVFYAYVTGGLYKPDDLVINNLYRRPNNSFGANLGVIVMKKMDVNLMYKFVGKRIDQDYGMYPPTISDLTSYHLLDVYIQYKPKSRLALFADFKNILDNDYVEVIGYTTKGFNFTTGIKLELFQK